MIFLMTLFNAYKVNTHKVLIINSWGFYLETKGKKGH